MQRFIVELEGVTAVYKVREALYHSAGGNWSIKPVVEESAWAEDSEDSHVRNDFGEPRVRMTVRQRDALWELCHRYNVPFREDDYMVGQKDNVFWSRGWAQGWVGGERRNGRNNQDATIFVGVSPEGQISS